MELCRAESLLRVIKTSFADVPYDNDELNAFIDDMVEDAGEDAGSIIHQLINWFQHNPLFTPEFAGEHPDIMIIPGHIAENPSWPLEDVVSYTMEIGDIRTRRVVMSRIIHTRYECVTEYLSILTGEPEGPNVDWPVESCTRTQPMSFESILRFIQSNGGFVSTFGRTRLIENIMSNPCIPVGSVINAAAQTGIPEAPTEWVRNPFCLYNPGGKSFLAIELYRNPNPENLRELLGLVRGAIPEVMERIREDEHTVIPYVFNSLMTMVLDNPTWDPHMEYEFGDIVWPLMWECLTRMYNSRGMFRTDEERALVRLYLHHRNPSWFLSRRLCEDYEANRPPVFTRIIPDGVYKEKCYDVLHTIPFREYFEEGFIKKKTLCVEDIKWFIQTGMEPYMMWDIVHNTELRGEAAIRIVRFLFKKWVLPRRRRRATEKVRMILLNASNGDDLSPAAGVARYYHTATAIASFLTA